MTVVLAAGTALIAIALVAGRLRRADGVPRWLKSRRQSI
jgi:hypothetical protein